MTETPTWLVPHLPWVRKHDPAGHPVVGSAPLTAYPQSLEDLLLLCVQPPQGRLHACGSHWGLSTAALSDHVFIETHDPSNEWPGLDRTLREVVPGCLGDDYVQWLVGAAGNNPDDLRYLMHFQAGKRIYQAYAELDQGDAKVSTSLARLLQKDHGTNAYLGSWAFPTLGGAGGQTIAGAAMTGTHGGDFRRPPLADCIVAMHLVLPGGRHAWIERPAAADRPQVTDDAKLQSLYGVARYGGADAFSVYRDADTFDAALVSVGRFGIVYSVVVDAVSQHGLHERRRLHTWQEVRQHVGNPGSGLFHDRDAGPGGQRFLQVAISPTPSGHEGLNPAGVTRRWEVPVPLDPDTGMATGRAQRRGELVPGHPEDRPEFTMAGRNYPYTPDIERPYAADEPSLLLRAASHPNILLGAVHAVAHDIRAFIAGTEPSATEPLPTFPTQSGPDPGSWTRLNPAVLLERARRSIHGQEELHRRVPSAGRRSVRVHPGCHLEGHR